MNRRSCYISDGEIHTLVNPTDKEMSGEIIQLIMPFNLLVRAEHFDHLMKPDDYAYEEKKL